MAIIKTFDVACDHINPETGEACLAWEHGVTGRYTANAGAARKQVRSAGWVHRKGNDLCPSHVR